MARRISISLSRNSVQNALKQIEEYKRQLKTKNEIFVERLAELGIPIIDKRIADAQGDSDKKHDTYIEVNTVGSYSVAKLIVKGEDIVFIEFGAGITYNTPVGTSPHPKYKEFGYTIGSYGKGQGKNEFWYYYDKTGEAVRSYGTEATMPVYSASIEIIQNIRRIAKEVFGN